MPIRPVKRDATDMYANINPRPRRPPPPSELPANDDAPPTASPDQGKRKGRGKRLKNGKSKWEAIGDHSVGDCRPPVSGQFKPGNPGGPGRPSKSLNQETILRRELEEKRTITVGGKPKKLANRELLAKLTMKEAIEGEARWVKFWLETAERLYPKPAAAPDEQETLADDQAILKDFFAIMSMGQPATADEPDDEAEPLEPEEGDFWGEEEDPIEDDEE